MSRNRFLRLLPWLVALLLVAWTVRTVDWTETWAALRQLAAWEIGVLIVANALVLLAIAGRWWLLLAALGHRLPFARLFGFRLAAFGLSYFTPGPHVGGEPLQVLLAERDGVGRPDALAAVALDKALEFAVNFTFLLVGLLLVVRWRIVPGGAGVQAAGLAAVLLAVPLLYLLAAGSGRSPFGRTFSLLGGAPLLSRSGNWRVLMTRLAETSAAGESQIAAGFRRSPLTLLAAVIVSVVGWVLMIAEYWLMVAFLCAQLPLPQLVTTLTAARISILLLLPAGLGALEASQTVAFSAVGLSASLGLAVSLLIRARDTLVAAAGLWWGTRQLRAKAPDPEATGAQSPPP
jgi:uncharacterized protein (TIRG00374 family)